MNEPLYQLNDAEPDLLRTCHCQFVVPSILFHADKSVHTADQIISGTHHQKIIRVYDVRVHIVQVVRSLIEITVRKSLGFMMQGSHVPPFKPITVQVDLMTGHHYVEAIYQRIIFYYSRVGQSQEIHKCFQ